MHCKRSTNNFLKFINYRNLCAMFYVAWRKSRTIIKERKCFCRNSKQVFDKAVKFAQVAQVRVCYFEREGLAFVVNVASVENLLFLVFVLQILKLLV